MPDQHRNRITVILDPGTLGASRIAGTLEKGPCDPLGIATRFRGQEPIEHFITEDVEDQFRCLPSRRARAETERLKRVVDQVTGELRAGRDRFTDELCSALHPPGMYIQT